MKYSKLSSPLCTEYLQSENTISMGSMDYVIIEKLYGPYVFDELRIKCDTFRGGWVIEKKQLDKEKWKEVLFLQQ